MIKHTNNERGYIALTSVLLVSAVVLAMSVTTSMTSINDSQATLSGLKSEQSLNFTEGCMEDALLKLRAKSSYSGGTISRPEGNCAVSVSQNSGTYTIIVTNNDPDHPKTVTTKVARTSRINLQSWEIN